MMNMKKQKGILALVVWMTIFILTACSRSVPAATSAAETPAASASSAYETTYEQNTPSNGLESPGPVDILPRLEKAYNSQDIYAIIECFEPSVAQMLWGVTSIMGLNADVAKNILPFASQALGASNAMENDNWGKVTLSGVSADINGNSALLTYEIKLTYKNGSNNTFTESIETVSVDGKWYISAFQSGWAANDAVIAHKMFPMEYEGELFRAKRNGKWGFVNEDDEVIFDFEYDDTGEFNDKRAWVYSQSQGGYGYIDKRNAFLIADASNPVEYPYHAVTNFSDGIAAVEKDRKWGYIDTTGKETVPVIYEEVGSYADGLIPAKLDGYWGFVDKDGNTVIDFIYTDISGSFMKEKTGVCINDAWGVIDKAGNYILPLSKEFKEPFYFSDSVIFSKGGIFDLSGNSLYDLDTNFKRLGGEIIVFNNGKHIAFYNYFESHKYGNDRYVVVFDMEGNLTNYILSAYIENKDSTDSSAKWIEVMHIGNSPNEVYKENGFCGIDATIYTGSGHGMETFYNRFIVINAKGVYDKNSETPLIKPFTEPVKTECRIFGFKDKFYLDAQVVPITSLTDGSEYNYFVDEVFDQGIATVTDETGIFFGLFSAKDGLVYNIEYTNITYDSNTNIFTLERGADKTLVWFGPNGNHFEITE